ncbi:uncharacterized protein LOC6725214 [Drosophila simulans]|uniref:GD16229 n=1 Tax=Drosophila simulans TaxID=7240 RepID=B4R538_DROSI|nr:uncharacterized protein LOC6725214 [Drosophila simulans]EDX17187.1 GD16229 [Drosophila simulans]KMZ08371.1 uncharacterized protein Dsimw501_GD16229 [Drosophila simulans]
MENQNEEMQLNRETNVLDPEVAPMSPEVPFSPENFQKEEMKLNREKKGLDPELASMSLDQYYEKYVKKPVSKGKSFPPPPNPSISDAQLRFQRTHYFGPAYRQNLDNPTVTAMRARLAELRKGIEQGKAMMFLMNTEKELTQLITWCRKYKNEQKNKVKKYRI